MIRPDFRQIKHSTELYHYGMPRRSGRYPWGSGKKPYQDALKGISRSDYFRSERTIPKGTKMYRTVSKYNKESGIDKNSPTYVTYLGPDRDLYKGGHIRFRDRAKNTYEYEMILKDDLKVPSRQAFIDTMKDIIDKNPKLFKESVSTYLDMRIPEDSWDRFYINDDPVTGTYDTKRWDKYVKASYLERKGRPIEEQWGLIAVTLGKNDNMKNAIIDNLKSKGYNAMVDEASVGGFQKFDVEGIDPLIVFDSSVLDVKKVSEISKKAEEKSSEKYDQWAKKSRSNSGNW